MLVEAQKLPPIPFSSRGQAIPHPHTHTHKSPARRRTDVDHMPPSPHRPHTHTCTHAHHNITGYYCWNGRKNLGSRLSGMSRTKLIRSSVWIRRHSDEKRARGAKYLRQCRRLYTRTHIFTKWEQKNREHIHTHTHSNRNRQSNLTPKHQKLS